MVSSCPKIKVYLPHGSNMALERITIHFLFALGYDEQSLRDNGNNGLFRGKMTFNAAYESFPSATIVINASLRCLEKKEPPTPSKALWSTDHYCITKVKHLQQNPYLLFFTALQLSHLDFKRLRLRCGMASFFS